MTYQERIEALRSTLYDYDDVCDNRPDYFDYDEPYASGELYGFDGLGEYGACYDSYRSDVPGDGTIFHRAWFDDRSVGAVPVPIPTVTEDRDRPLSSDFEPPGDIKTNGIGFGGPFPCAMDAPILDDTEVSDRLPSETQDLAGDLGWKTESPLSGFGKPSTGDIQCLHVCSRVRRDEKSSLLAGLDTLVVSVYHPMFSNFDSEFGTSWNERMLAPLGTR